MTHGVVAHAGRVVRGDDDDGRTCATRALLVEQVDPGHSRQFDVADDAQGIFDALDGQQRLRG